MIVNIHKVKEVVKKLPEPVGSVLSYVPNSIRLGTDLNPVFISIGKDI